MSEAFLLQRPEVEIIKNGREEVAFLIVDNQFINNEASLMPSLSNWEIKISRKSIKELEKYILNNMINNLKA